MNFTDTLKTAHKKNNSLLCVGLDPVIDKLPISLQSKEYPIFEFNKAIIDVTHDLVCAYKPNMAFYEAYGIKGIEQLKMTCDYIKNNYPDLLLILDAKRADIGSTNVGYVMFAYEYLRADAITLHPYLGQEAMQPFLDCVDKGAIILCKTSNPGSNEFQSLVCHTDVSSKNSSDTTLYKHIAHAVSSAWNTNRNCMLVVGATYPEELAEVRKIVGDMPLLVPGIGAQGGDLESTLEAGLTAKKDGLIISVSRSVIYASSLDDFAEKARSEATQLQNSIQSYVNNH